MNNYDIPWYPVRLEQRMGRIHRYGQEHDCVISNFVAINTREGRVLQKLLERLAEIRHELGTDHVFDVVGEVFPSNLLEGLFREMYAKRTDLPNIEARIVREVDAGRFRRITDSTLEGLAKRELNLASIVAKSAEAREHRLIPEVIEDFFTTAGPIAGINPRPVQKDGHIYRIGKVPRTLAPIGERLESRFGKLGREYQKVVFDKTLLPSDPTLEWITPGHPLFEASEGQTYYISIDVNDRSFFQLGYFNFWSIDDEKELARALECANRVTGATKVAKVFVRNDKKNVIATVEIFVDPIENFKPVFSRALSALRITVERFAERHAA